MKTKATIPSLFLVAACAFPKEQTPGKTPERVPDLETRSFRLYGFDPRAAAWFQRQHDTTEALFGVDLAADRKIEIHRSRDCWANHCPCSTAYCEADESYILYCEDACPDRLGRLYADLLGPAPRILRDGMAEVLAGGLAYGGRIDFPIPLGTIDFAALLDDDEYVRAKDGTDQNTAILRFERQSAAFLRFLLDELGSGDLLSLYRSSTPATWVHLTGRTIEAWTDELRSTRTFAGRSYRLPLAECSSTEIQLGEEIVTDVSPPDPFYYTFATEFPLEERRVFTFDLPEDGSVRVEVVGGLASYAFIEACNSDLGSIFAAGGMNAVERDRVAAERRIPAGRYFVVVGDVKWFEPPGKIRLFLKVTDA